MQQNVTDLYLNLCSCYYLAKGTFLLDRKACHFALWDASIFVKEENLKT